MKVGKISQNTNLKKKDEEREKRVEKMYLLFQLNFCSTTIDCVQCDVYKGMNPFDFLRHDQLSKENKSS